MDNTAFCEFTVNVLGSRKDGEWEAIALEMDLRGYGDTFEEALNDLLDHIKIQISFAQFKEQPDMIFHPADMTFFNLFAQIRADSLRSLGKNIDTDESDFRFGSLPLPPSHVIEKYKKEGYAIANG